MPEFEPGTTTEEIRAWAGECYELMKDRALEQFIWQALAERGEEWQPRLNKDGTPYHGGALMTPRECFTNSQRTLFGCTAFDPEGCSYAEGWALTHLGMWQHHGWLVDKDGLVIDRTYRQGARRYIGVVCIGDDMNWRIKPEPDRVGQCLLTWMPAGMAWAPGMKDEHAELLFSH